MSDPLPEKYLEEIRSRAKRTLGSAIRHEEWKFEWVASPVVILQLCEEIDRLKRGRHVSGALEEK